MKNNERLTYIDCLRGFGMILVVYQHILVIGLPEIGSSWLNDIIITFRMPLFFFISGYVSYKHNILNWGIIKKTIYKKLRGQLLPTIFIFSTCILIYDLDLKENILHFSKRGYWFTLVAFEIYIVYLLVSWSITKIRNLNTKLLILSAFAITISIGCSKIFTIDWNNDPLSLGNFIQYFIYFIAGIIAKAKTNNLHILIEDKYFTFILFIIAFVLPTFLNLSKSIVIISRVISIYSIFYKYRSFFDTNKKLSIGLSVIGKNTLAIYFLHYFLLFKMTHLQDFLNQTACVNDTNAIWILVFIICIGISIVLCYICIIIKKIIDVFPIVSQLYFGPNTKK